MKIAYFCIVLLWMVSLSSCATVHVAPQHGSAHKIAGVPFYPQRDYQCGPAALAIVLNFWGIRVTPDEVAREIFSKSARGTLNIDMVIYAQKKGLYAAQYGGDITGLRSLIDTGYPAIVLVDNGFSLYQANHFMVVTGYNESGVIVSSGKDRDEFIEEKDFLRTWEKTGFWTLLIKPAV